MKTVYLYGELGKKYGKKHELNISNILESIRAFAANFPNKFLKDFRKCDYKLLHGDKLFTNDDELHMNYDSDYHIVPVIAGSKSSFFQAFIGVILIAAAFHFGGPIAGWSAIHTGMAMMGAGLILGAFLTPQVQDYSQREEADERPSFLFNGPTNTTEQGGGIPLIYGRMIVGSHIISAEIDVEDI